MTGVWGRLSAATDVSIYNPALLLLKHVNGGHGMKSQLRCECLGCVISGQPRGAAANIAEAKTVPWSKHRGAERQCWFLKPPLDLNGLSLIREGEKRPPRGSGESMLICHHYLTITEELMQIRDEWIQLLSNQWRLNMHLSALASFSLNHFL